MGFLHGAKLESMEDLYVQQLEDLYDAEKRLSKALNKMAEAAAASDLRQAFQEHQQQTVSHIDRLEQIFRQMGKAPARETCKAMKGLIDEGQDMIDAEGDQRVRDAGLIAAAQRVEHYEIAGYGTACAFAQQLGHQEAASLLQQTLDEEGATDKRLTTIAESHINPEAGAV